MSRLGWLTIVLAWAALGLVAPAAAGEPKEWVVGRAIVLDNVPQPEDAPLLMVPCETTDPKMECLPWLSWMKIRIRVTDLYAGKLEGRTIVVWIALHAEWLLQKEGRPFLLLPRIYFVGRMVKGEFNIVTWDDAGGGFCLLTDKDARDIGFEAEIAQVKRDHPCPQ